MFDSRWFEIIRYSPDADVTLCCFPHAGGGASFFYACRDFLPSCINLVAAQLPGRETRFDESLSDSLQEVVNGFYNDLNFLENTSFYFFGHSLGAIIAFELCKKLKDNNRELPEELIVSGCRAPHIPARYPLHHLPDKEFLQGIKNYNGTPEKVFTDNQELLELLIPIMRSDCKLAETYSPIYHETMKLKIPILGLYGQNDPTLFQQDMLEWQYYTHNEFCLHKFPGDHFFINQNRHIICELLMKKLRQEYTS